MPIPDTEFPKSMRLAVEKEMLGLYVSDHPLMGAERALRRYTDSTLSELKEAREGEMRVVGGIVTGLARKYTKRGDLMATFVLEDLGVGDGGDGLPAHDDRLRPHARGRRDRVRARAASTSATTCRR